VSAFAAPVMAWCGNDDPGTPLVIALPAWIDEQAG
jgi:hypothetical protein